MEVYSFNIQELLNSDARHRWVLVAHVPSERIVFDKVMKDRTAFKRAYNWMFGEFGACYVDTQSPSTVYLHDSVIVGAIVVKAKLFTRGLDLPPYKPLSMRD